MREFSGDFLYLQKEEQVNREEYDRLQGTHRQEMEQLTDEYE